MHRGDCWFKLDDATSPSAAPTQAMLGAWQIEARPIACPPWSTNLRSTSSA